MSKMMVQVGYEKRMAGCACIQRYNLAASGFLYVEGC
jgi:hypothetical protein